MFASHDLELAIRLELVSRAIDEDGAHEIRATRQVAKLEGVCARRILAFDDRSPRSQSR
jgi:hypothetical protein